MEKKIVWVGVYNHRHGSDFAVFAHEPTVEELEQYWKDEYEPEREDEFLEIYGPREIEE